MTSADNNSIQGTASSKWVIGAYGSILLVLLLVIGYLLVSLLTWLFRPSTKSTLPRPVVVSKKLEYSILKTAEMKISVRNDGPPGLVKIEVYSLLDVGGDFTRGESGAEKALRETFTRNLEPQSNYVPNYKPITHGITTEHFGQGESKTISIPLPTYNWTHHLSGQVMYVGAAGVLPQKVGGQ